MDTQSRIDALERRVAELERQMKIEEALVRAGSQEKTVLGRG